MKKWIALVMVLALALAMVPAVGLADTSTYDVSDIETYEVSSTDDFFNNCTITNTTGKSYGFHQIHIKAIDGSTIENVTFDTGVQVEIFAIAKYGNQAAHVTFKNCTFNGTPAAKYEYAVIMSGGNITFENCTFNRVYRAINANHSAAADTSSSLTVTGCTFDLEPITDPESVTKNIGIQLANNPAGTAPFGWRANSVNITGSTFKNCYVALRLHERFVLHTDFPTDGTLAVFKDNVLQNCLSAIAPDADASDTKKEELNNIIVGSVAETGTTKNNVNGGNTEVKADVEPTFTIVIPAAVDFGKLTPGTGTAQQNFPVKAEGLFIEDGKQINVSLKTLLPMKAGNVELPYTLKNSTAEVTVDEVFATFIGNRTETGAVLVDRSLITKAGAYRGTMTFTIAYVNAPVAP